MAPWRSGEHHTMPSDQAAKLRSSCTLAWLSGAPSGSGRPVGSNSKFRGGRYMLENEAGSRETNLALDEVDDNLNAANLGLEALMDLMGSAPAQHRVRTVALHALMLALSDQVGQAQQACAVAQLQGRAPMP